MGASLHRLGDAPISRSRTITEGFAEVLVHTSTESDKEVDEVFYNPAQVFNRDLSVLVLFVFAQLRSSELAKESCRFARVARDAGCSRADGLSILEALGATGIRSIRYAKELGEGPQGVRRIVCNDLDPTAVAQMKNNLKLNGLANGCVETTCGDAAGHMYAKRATGSGGVGKDSYDVIDVDPYGTAAPFLDAAVQAVAHGGLLCITSTDMPVLGGSYPEACFARYGGTALKAGYLHEMSLRLLVHAVASSAARYGREARPVLCCSIDFYIRVFIRVFDSAARAKLTASKTGFVSQCVQCDSFFLQSLGKATAGGKGQIKYKPARLTVPGECPECSGQFEIGGPFHAGSLYDQEFIGSCLQICESGAAQLPGITSWKKITGMLSAISEEHQDIILFYRFPQLCKSLKLTPMPLKQFRATLRSLGFRVSHFHRDPEAIKTDAPNHIVFDLLRVWAADHPPAFCPLAQILERDISIGRPVEWKVEDRPQGAKVAKFLPNPTPNWGPKARAKGGLRQSTPQRHCWAGCFRWCL